MKLIEINNLATYKAKNENIYYKRNGEYVFKSYFYSEDIDDYKFIVKSIDELNGEVVEMDLAFNINYSYENKELSLKIRQANTTIYLNDRDIRSLLQEIDEVINSPF